ncbi:MAG: hypothetical protein JNM45_08205 [Rhizobiales bacterium]|nr:hypothetical protein [Hyphomicrobiales bacterium]
MQRIHLAIILTFVGFGSIVGTHTGAIPTLVTRSGMSPYAFGIAGSLGMLINIGCMAAGGYINRFASPRTILLYVLPSAFLVLLGALLTTSVTGFFVSFLLLSACIGTLDIFMNAEASLVEHELQRPVFSTYHACAMLSIAGFALLGSLTSVLLSPWFGALLAGVPLFLGWAGVLKHLPERDPVVPVIRKSQAPMPRGILTIIGLAAGFNVTCEVAAIQWSGQLLAAIAPELAAISGLGLCFFGLCSGTMRLFGDYLRTTFGDLRVMAVGLSLAVAGFAGLGLAPGFWMSALAFAAVGVGLALVFPCLFSMAGRLAPNARAAAMSYTALVGGLPRVTLPWMLGILAASNSVHTVFSACAILALAALVLVVLAFARAGHRLRAT